LLSLGSRGDDPIGMDPREIKGGDLAGRDPWVRDPMCGDRTGEGPKCRIPNTGSP